MAEYSLDQQLIRSSWSGLGRRMALAGAGLLLIGKAALWAMDGADAAAALHYTEVREQRGAALAGHRPWAWQVETPRARIWIIGCLHLGAARDAAVFPAYAPAYHSAATIYFETMPGAWNAYEVRQLMDQRGFQHDRQTLSGKVSKQTWQDVRTALASRPEKLASISSMEPWLAAFSLVQEEYNRTGLHAEDSLEKYYEKLAIEDQKPVGALETPKDQILAMADASEADQEEFLRDTANGLKNLAAETQNIREAWLAGDDNRLENALGLNSSSARSGMHQSLIGARNRHWVRKIQAIADRGKNAMILVGVEHLVAAPYALPDLLAQAGFTVHRADPSAKRNVRPPATPASIGKSAPVPYPYHGQPAQ